MYGFHLVFSFTPLFPRTEGILGCCRTAVNRRCWGATSARCTSPEMATWSAMAPAPPSSEPAAPNEFAVLSPAQIVLYYTRAFGT